MIQISVAINDKEVCAAKATEGPASCRSLSAACHKYGHGLGFSRHSGGSRNPGSSIPRNAGLDPGFRRGDDHARGVTDEVAIKSTALPTIRHHVYEMED